MSNEKLDRERGRKVAEQLKARGVSGILINAAEQGIITSLRCLMDECLCPEGEEYFVKRPDPVSPWAPSVDHWYVLKSEGGKLELDNVRLAHVLCNRVDYAKKHDIKHDKDLATVAAWTKETDINAAEIHRHLLRDLGARFAESSLAARDRALSSVKTANEEFENGRVHAYFEVIA
jgi:hypothetical protein